MHVAVGINCICVVLFIFSLGFLCPVHTPDGTPCGLLNHLSANAQVTCASSSTRHEISEVLYSLGVCPLTVPSPSGDLDVLLDGLPVGRVPQDVLNRVGSELRMLKVKGNSTGSQSRVVKKKEMDEKIPATLEIAVVPPLKGGQFPGLFLFSTPARMMRAVLNLATQTNELIGTFEQVELLIKTHTDYDGPKNL